MVEDGSVSACEDRTSIPLRLSPFRDSTRGGFATDFSSFRGTEIDEEQINTSVNKRGRWQGKLSRVGKSTPTWEKETRKPRPLC